MRWTCCLAATVSTLLLYTVGIFCSALFCQLNRSELPVQMLSLPGLMLHQFGGFLETVGLSWYHIDVVILFLVRITCHHIIHS